MTNQTATRKFTDRTEPQAAFQNAYLDLASRMPGSNNSQILTYYGMGGIGKSTLLEKLADNLKTQRAFTEKNNGKPLFVSLNFEVCQEDIQVLTRLRNILSDSYGWQFPLFELGLYLYGRSIGEDIDLPETKTVAGQQAPLVRFAIDMASELPVVGPFLKIFSLVDQGQAALRTLLNQHKDLVQQFEKYSPTQQREALPGLFAADLNAYTEKVKAPLVLFLDTYECIEERAATQGSAMRRDYWLHGDSRLIAETKNALWVIAGRNQIQWSVAGCPMEQHLLGSLSDEDACSFLIGAGLPEDLIPHIY